MAPNKRKLTRGKSGQKIGGTPSELPQSDLPTNKDVIKFFYFVKNSDNLHDEALVSLVAKSLVELWQKVNPRLPLKSNLSIKTKIRTLWGSVKNYNGKKLNIAKKKFLESSLDKLFDLAACSCALPTLPCDSRFDLFLCT